MDFSGAVVQIHLIDVSRCVRCIVFTMKVALTPCCRACGSYSSSLSPTVPLLTGGGRPQVLGSHVPQRARVSVHAWNLRLRSVPVTYLRDVVRRSVAFQLA